MATGVQKIHETRGFFGKSDAQQRVDAERGIADPGIAIIPVALAADGFGKAAGGRGDDGAGWLKRQQFQKQRAAVDGLAPAAMIGGFRKPAPPKLGGRAEQFVAFLLPESAV